MVMYCIFLGLFPKYFLNVCCELESCLVLAIQLMDLVLFSEATAIREIII